MQVFEMASALSALRGVSGRECIAHGELEKLCEGFFDTVHVTPTGCFIGVKKCGKENAPRLMFDAHLDEVGFLVKDICDGGFLKVVAVGGIDTGILSASEVVVHGKEEFNGVFTSTPPHLRKGASDEKPKLSELSIDTGLSTEKLKEIAPIGTPVSYKSEVIRLGKDRLAGKSFDDRICMLVILRALELLRDKNIGFDIYALFASGEETGYIGGRTGAFDVDPDVAIALDVGNAYVPGGDEIRKNNRLGNGGVISYSATLDPFVTQLLIDTAKKENIPFQTVAEATHTGTDGHILQLTREGIPGGLVSVPLFNMHTYNEVCSMTDLESCSALLAAFAVAASDTYLCERKSFDMIGG